MTIKASLFISFLLLSTMMVLAQPAEIKRLRATENLQKADSNQVLWYYQLSKAYAMTKPDSSAYAAKKGIALAKKIHLRKKEALCYSMLAIAYSMQGLHNESIRNCARAIEINKVVNKPELALNYTQMGIFLQRKGKFREAIYYHTLSLKVAERYNDSLALCRTLNNLGLVYLDKGEFLRAGDHFFRLLEISERRKYDMGISMASVNISAILKIQKDYKRALEFANKALLVNLKLNNTYTTLIIYEAIASIHTELGDKPRAIHFFEKAIQLAKQTGVTTTLSSCFTSLGAVYTSIGKYEKAVGYLLQAEAIDKESTSNYGLADTYVALSEVYEKTNKPHLQEKYAKQALKLAQKESLKTQIRDASKSLYVYYKNQGDASRSLYYLELHTRYKDSLFNEENIKQLKTAEYRYAKKSQAREIQLLKNQNELKEQENNLQRIYLYGSFILFLGAIGFIVYYLRQIKIKNRLYESLREKNVYIEEQSRKLQELNLVKNKVISVMSHDMRSPVNSLEMLLTMQEDLDDPEELGMIIKELKPAVNSLSLLLENILGWAKSQMQSTREITITPVNVFIIAEEIVGLYTPTSSRKHVSMVNQVPENTWINANKDYLTLVLRNLISNAIKFSPTGESITISASPGEQIISIIVSDKGIGMREKEIAKLFNVDRLYTSNGTNNEKGTGLGLIFVKESVELCGGNLIIKSEKNKGSQFICQFPVAPSPIKDVRASAGGLSS